MRISDWSSDVSSSDLYSEDHEMSNALQCPPTCASSPGLQQSPRTTSKRPLSAARKPAPPRTSLHPTRSATSSPQPGSRRSEEHTSELQSLMRISYAVFCLKKKNKTAQTRRKQNT